MTESEEVQLRQFVNGRGLWTNSDQARWMVRLALAEIDRLRAQIAGHCERIAKQSDALSKRAEKTFELAFEGDVKPEDIPAEVLADALKAVNELAGGGVRLVGIESSDHPEASQ